MKNLISVIVAFLFLWTSTAAAQNTGSPSNSGAVSSGAVSITGGAGAGSTTESVVEFNFQTGGSGAAGAAGADGAAGAAGTSGGTGTGRVIILQLPGLLASPTIQANGHMPAKFINEPVYAPAVMTMEQAKRCKSGKTNWTGGADVKATESIQLLYTATIPRGIPMARYVGTGGSEGDHPIAALCQVAYTAMKEGGNVAYITWAVAPETKQSGIGFGSSGGASIVPSLAAANPYAAVAGALGFGFGSTKLSVTGRAKIMGVIFLSDNPVPDPVPPQSSETTDFGRK